MNALRIPSSEITTRGSGTCLATLSLVLDKEKCDKKKSNLNFSLQKQKCLLQPLQLFHLCYQMTWWTPDHAPFSACSTMEKISPFALCGGSRGMQMPVPDPGLTGLVDHIQDGVRLPMLSSQASFQTPLPLVQKR